MRNLLEEFDHFLIEDLTLLSINKFKLTFVIQILHYDNGICSDQLLFRTLISTLQVYFIC